MKKIMSILAVLVVGVLVLSGVGIAAVSYNKAAKTTNNLVIMDNHPPDRPIISGPLRIGLGTHNWTFKAVDPDGDNVSFEIDWFYGEGEEIGPYASGEEVTRNHTYYVYGHITISARAKDTYGALGNWSYLDVTVHKNKQQSKTGSSSQNTVSVIPSSGTIGKGEIEQLWGLSSISITVNVAYGSVDDPQYRPLPDVEVTVIGGFVTSLGGIFHETTGENGKCSFVAMGPGMYMIKASKEGYTDISSGIKGFRILEVKQSSTYEVIFILAEKGSPFSQHSTQAQSHSSQQSSSRLSGQNTVGVIPSTRNRASFDDNTPPVTTHSLDPENPDGENGWYVSDVIVTLNATDDESGVKEIKYTIDGVPGSITGNHGTFKIEDDGKNIEVEYWAIDNVGNTESKHSFTIDMDQTVPEMEIFYWGLYVNDSKLFVRFKLNCSDETSRMDRVEFYVNDSLEFTDYEEPYEWIIEKSEILPGVYKAMVFDNAGNSDFWERPPFAGACSFTGLILNLEISDEKVTFFAVMVMYTHDDGYGIPDRDIRILKHFSFPNNYQGHIGRFFIHATFYNI